MRFIDEIIVHCAATKPHWMSGHSTADKVAEIRDWHVNDNGWSDIGYHYLIDRDGTVATGRPVARKGAHVAGHNANTIGICLIGGFGSSASDSFSDHFTTVQDSALRGLIAKLKAEFPIAKVTGHNRYANKARPGFDVPHWMAQAASGPAPVQGDQETDVALSPQDMLRAVRDRIDAFLAA